ncbi:hypothetical protein QYE76_040038 [Lolium multiflorum]|uniref:Uncharacterized protein n=1 Tax=Lolium multiflorum TaxID=4521 RepID=A0AAD8TAH8_LOLMU|nr:hypothetical protein QYE76_040038 [Lolium multiflorum]
MRAVKKEASAYKAGPSNINIVGRCFWDQLGTFSDEKDEFLAPERRENCWACLQLHIHEAHEAARARFHCEHSELMHAESEFYVARGVKNKQASASEAGPFIVKVSSDDEMDDASRIS